MAVTKTPSEVASGDRKVIRPPSDQDAALTGWKVQRANLIREGSETAAVALAVRENRIIRPSHNRTVTVELPAGFSRREDADDVEGFHADTPIFKDRENRETGETETAALTFREVVTVPITWTVDPRQRWTARQLLNAAQSAARAERKTIRPQPSEDAAMDAASDVIVRILGREAGKNDDRSAGMTGGAMPYREAVNKTYLRQAVKGAMLDAIRPNHGGQIDAAGGEALPDVDTALQGADIGETLAAAGGDWANGLIDPSADPTAPDWEDAYTDLELSSRERAAATGAILNVGPAAMSAAGVAARDTLKRGRADLRKRDAAPEPDAIDGPWKLYRDKVNRPAIREAFKTARKIGDRPDHAREVERIITEGPLVSDPLVTADAARRTILAGIIDAPQRITPDCLRRAAGAARTLDAPRYNGRPEPIIGGHPRPIAQRPDRTPAKNPADEGDAFHVPHSEPTARKVEPGADYPQRPATALAGDYPQASRRPRRTGPTAAPMMLAGKVVDAATYYRTPLVERLGL